jgi:hypothetical protein
MQVSVENTGGLERRLKVQVPGKEIQDKVESKLKELSKQVRIKGFRPGRVPMSVVRQRYGKQVQLDIVNETMQRSLQQAIRSEGAAGLVPRVDAMPEPLAGGDPDSAPIEVYRKSSRSTSVRLPSNGPKPRSATRTWTTCWRPCACSVKPGRWWSASPPPAIAR